MCTVIERKAQVQACKCAHIYEHLHTSELQQSPVVEFNKDNSAGSCSYAWHQHDNIITKLNG